MQSNKIEHVTAVIDPWTQIVIMIVSAISFVASFAWNNTITTVLDQKFGKNRSIKVHIIYTVAITAVALIAIYYIVKYTNVTVNQQEEDSIINP